MQLEQTPETITTMIRAELVRSILEKKGSAVWFVHPTAIVYEAIAMMDEKQVGALMVLSDDKLVGVISERDYARKVFLKGRSSKDTLVREIMTSPVITVTPGHKVDECLRLMSQHRIRHLPVLDGDSLVGVVSIGDLVNAVISAQAETIHQMSDYIAGTYPGR